MGRGGAIVVVVSSAVLLGMLMVGGRPAVAADAAAEAEPLIRQGLMLRHQKKDEQALPLFQKAYELVRTPRTEGQLGLVEMALGYWLDADEHLVEVLKVADHPWVAKNRKALQDALAQVRRNIGEVAVDGAPRGAAIVVNGRAAGTAPLSAPLRVGKGRVEISVSAPGFRATTSTVEVEGGDRKKVVIALEKEAKAPPVEAAPVLLPPPAPMAVTSGADAAARDQAGAPARGTARRKAAWITGIGAGAVLAAAVTETVVWQLKRRDFETHKGPPSDDPTLAPDRWQRDCGLDEPGRGAPACQTLYDAAHRAQTFALIGYAVGGALAVTSGVLFLGGRGHGEGEMQVACAPVPIARGFGCRLSF